MARLTEVWGHLSVRTARDDHGQRCPAAAAQTEQQALTNPGATNPEISSRVGSGPESTLVDECLFGSQRFSPAWTASHVVDRRARFEVGSAAFSPWLATVELADEAAFL